MPDRARVGVPLNGPESFLIWGASELRYSRPSPTYSWVGVNVVYSLCRLLFPSEALIGCYCVFDTAEWRYGVAHSNSFVG